jgi:hypothetical protein
MASASSRLRDSKGKEGARGLDKVCSPKQIKFVDFIWGDLRWRSNGKKKKKKKKKKYIHIILRVFYVYFVHPLRVFALFQIF